MDNDTCEANNDLISKIAKYEKQNEFLSAAIACIGDGVIATDTEGTVTLINSAAEELTGWKQSEAVGKHIELVFRLYNKKDVNLRVSPFAIAMKKGEKTGLERGTVLVSRNGMEYYVSASNSPIRNKNSDIVGFITVFRDITSYRLLEEGLKRYQLLSENANDIILFSDIDGRIIEVNEAALRAYGYTREEIFGKSIFFLVNPDPRSPVGVQPHQANEKGIYYEATAYRKDGSTFAAEVSMQGTEIGDSKVLMAILRDVTERKNYNEALKQAKEAAEAANHAKSEFLANMSHEIRTPLNGMLGMIDLTLLTDLNEEQQDNLQTAKTCAETLLNLINDILDFSKIEAGKLTVNNVDFCITELIYQTIRPHSVKAQSKGVELFCRFDAKMPQIVNGDPDRLKQVLNNILGNAVKFTDKGEVCISVKVVSIQEAQVELEFQISDTGIGIPEKDKDKLFKSFSQLDSSDTKKYGGTGLGLAISKKLVELMGGTIYVESEKGKGSTFIFTTSFRTASKPDFFS